MHFLKRSLALLVIGVGLIPFLTHAQNEPLVPLELRPVIVAQDAVRLNRTIIFDASRSVLLNTVEPVQYAWDFGDGATQKKGAEAVHAYAKPGEYRVTLTIAQGTTKASIARDVFVYKKLVLMITDIPERKDNIDQLAEAVKKEGTYIQVISSADDISSFLTEENLTKQLADAIISVRDSDALVVWTMRSNGINALTRLLRETPLDSEIIAQKTIVNITDGSIKTAARTLQSSYNLMKPKQIILVRENELKNLVVAPSIDEFVKGLQGTISDYFIVNAETGRVSLWNFVSHLVNAMIVRGVPANTILLLLMLPLIATLVAFMKQVVGLSTFGVYTPSVIALSFVAMGLKFGLLLLILIVAAGVLLRALLDRFNLLHIPRVTIIMTITSLILLLMLALGTHLGLGQISSVAVFPMLIMTTLAEKFASVQSGQGFKGALFAIGETTFISLLCYFIVQLKFFQTLLLGYPEIIFALILINIILGRWTGLRLLEYMRFREVFKHAEE